MSHPRWFVYVDAEYYAETHIIEAETADEAARLARARTQGQTYNRYDDEGQLGDVYEIGGRWAEPACAVAPFEHVTFIGSENRIRHLVETDSYEWGESE